MSYASDVDRIYLSADILGGAAFEKAEESRLVKEMAKCINDKILSAIEGDKEKVYPVLKFGAGKQLFKSQFKSKKYIHAYRPILVGAIVDKNIGRNGLVFTARGLFVEEAFTGLQNNPEIVEYSSITCEDGFLSIGNKKYKNKNLNLSALYGIIQELSAMVKEHAKYENEDDLLLEQATMPMIEVFDYEEIDDEFEMQINTSIREKNAKEVECYGTVIKGMRPTIGDTVEIRRSGSICSMAEIIAFKSAAEGQEAIIWLRTPSEMDLVQGDLVKKN